MPFAPRLTLAALAVAGFASLPAAAHTQVYVGTLSGAKEAPANASPATGTAKLTVDDHENTIRIEFSFSGLMGNLTAAHIHGPTAAFEAGTAGVMTRTPTFTNTPTGVTSGSFNELIDFDLASSWNASYLNANPRNGDTSIAFSSLLDAISTGKAYLNLHSVAVPGGEIRTFFALAPVPEPGTYGLMLAGLAAVGWAAKRRRQA